MPKTFILSSALLALTLLGLTGCVKTAGGGTTNTSMYVFDNNAGQVLAWNDVNDLYDGAKATPATLPAPDRTITGIDISNQMPLAWGGLTVDTSANKLYLVSRTGVVTRIERAASQKGELTQTSDIVTFTLGDPSSDRYSTGSVFGQASVYSGTGTLFVTENSTDRVSARIWAISNAAGVANGSIITPALTYTLPSLVSDDKGFAGVAAGPNTMVYGFFPGGSAVYNNLGQNGQSGARIRSGKNTLTTAVIAGTNTLLTDASTTYGALGYDSNSNALYVSRQLDPSSTLPAVVVFNNSLAAGTTFNPAPSRSLDDLASSLPYLRFISHAGIKDWLAGADMLSTGLGANYVYLWKAPSGGGAAFKVELDTAGAIQVGGIALCGTN
jgi:hypothetical protein